MLRVNYNKKMGEVTLIQEKEDRKATFKIGIYQCNALAAFIHISKPDEQGERTYTLMNFFADAQHVRNLIKSKTELFWGKVTKVELNMWYKDNKDVLNYFTRMGHKVECYYKQPKEKGTKK